MHQRQYKDILAIKTDTGSVIGFHAKNLELAELSNEAWLALEKNSQTEARLELAEWNESQNPDVRSGKMKMSIRHLTLNVSQICNLHCTYCAAGGDGTYGDPIKRIAIEKTLPQLDFFLGKVKKGETFTLNLLGGEPLLYPKTLRAIVEHAQSIAEQVGFDIQYCITTNGTLLTEESIALLRDFHFNVSISLDGPPEINDLVRPAKNGSSSSGSLKEGLTRLLAHKEDLNSIGFNGVFGKHNTEVEKAYKFYQQFPVDFYEFNFSFNSPDSEASEKYTQGMEKVAALAFSSGGEKELRKIRFFDHYFKLLDEQQQVENYCDAGKGSLVIDARNNVYSCPWLVGSKKDLIGHGTLINETKLENEYAAPLIEANKCQSCWARYLCGGGCMYVHQSKTGDKNTLDSDFCERMRRLLSLTLTYYYEARSRQERRA